MFDPPLPLFPIAAPPSAVAIAPELTRMLVEDPVPRVRLASGHEVWLATRYDDVRRVLSDPRFTRGPGTAPDAPTLYPGTSSDESSMFNMDPPQHSRIRQLVARAFAARTTAQVRPRVAAVVGSLLDRMAEYGAPADLYSMLADPLPVTVICEIIGIPVEQRYRLRDWLAMAMDATAHPPEELTASVQQAAAYLVELMEQRRAEPADDLLTALVGVHDGGDRLTEPELLMIVLSLFGAGQETTAAQLALAALALFRFPDQWELLVDQPDLVPNAVEELLRFVPLGTSAFPRFASTDIELSTATIPAGDAVFAVLLAANRDPAVFPEPDRLDVTRTGPAPHVIFGHGIHYCLGAPLARLELQLALAGLLRKFPKLRLAIPEEEVEWALQSVVPRPAAVPVTW